MRVLLDIIQDLETSSSSPPADDAVLWQQLHEWNVFELLLMRRHSSTPKLLARILALGSQTGLPRTFVWHRTPEDDANNNGDVPFFNEDASKIDESIFDAADWGASMPIFVALVVHFIRDRVPFREAEQALNVCLQHTSQVDLSALRRARVGIRHTTLFAHCCASAAAEYAHLVLNNIATAERSAYVCVLDRATFSAEHYAHIKKLDSVLSRLRQSSSCVRETLLPPPPGALPREAHKEEARTERLQQGRIQPPPPPNDGVVSTVAETTNLIPGEPDEVRLRLVSGLSFTSSLLEEVALSRRSLRKMRKDPISVFVKCIPIGLPADEDEDEEGEEESSHFLFDSAAMRSAPRYIPLTALGFQPDGPAADAAIDLDALSTWHIDDTDNDDQLLIINIIGEEDTQRVQVMPLDHFQHMLPGLPFQVDADAQASEEEGRLQLANQFVAFAPDEQRALTRYHHDWDEAINGTLLFDAAVPARRGGYFNTKDFINSWQSFGATRHAAERNVVYTQRLIDQAFRRHAQPLLRDTEVYHGTDCDVQSQRRHPEYISTSPRLDVALFFADEKIEGCVLRIMLPRGLPVIYMEPLAVEHTGEYEVLLPRETMLARTVGADGMPLPTYSAASLNGTVTVVPMTATLSAAGRRILRREKDEEEDPLDPDTTAIGSSNSGNSSGRPRCKLLRILAALPSSVPTK